MIEETILNHLKGSISHVPVYTETPSEPPKEYIVFMISGIREESVNVYSCLLTVQSYSTSMFKTAQLNELVLDAMDGVVALNDVTHCTLNASGLMNDLTTKEYRYQSVFNLTFYRRSN